VPRSRLIIPALLVATLSLAACSSGDETPDAAETQGTSVDVCDTPGGDVVDAVTVTGDFGAQPTVDFESGLEVDATQRAVVIEGDGDETAAGDSLQVAYTVLNGSTGAVVDAYGYEEGETAQFVADPEVQLEGFAKAIGCVEVGSRVVAVIPPAEAFGEEGYADLEIGADDSLVLVVDVKGVQPTRAWGEDQPAPDGFPAVTLDDDGHPSVEIPDTEPPTDLQVGVLKLGDGPVVGEADTVVLQYHGVSWETGEVFDESWPTPTSFSLTGVVPGFAQAIAGQTVGSQVIAVIPPSLAYGEEGESDSELAGQTLVFVIDILGTTAG
jgi:peptidylprolyl isomerase